MMNQRRKIAISRNPSLALGKVVSKNIKAYTQSDLGRNIVICSFFALIISISAQIYISNTYAIKGYEMVSLMDKQSKLHREISKLELEVSEASSLTLIESKARALGFVEMSNAVSVINTPSAVTVASL